MANQSLIKLIFLGNSGVGKSCLMSKFSPDGCHTQHMKTIGIEYTARTIDLDGEPVKLQIWNTAGQERHRNIAKTFYQSAKGILLVYDVTDELSFTEIINWLRNIEEDHTNIKKILVGNKADLDESKRAVEAARGQALADEYNIQFFETSAETNMNVEEVFFSIARDIVLDSKASRVTHEPQTLGLNQLNKGEAADELSLGKIKRSQTIS